MFTTKQFYHVLLAWEENTRVRPLRNFWPFSQYILFFGMTIFYLFNYFDLKNFYQIKLNVAQLGMVALSMRIYTLLVWLQVITCRSWSLTHSGASIRTKTLNFVSQQVRTAAPSTRCQPDTPQAMKVSFLSTQEVKKNDQWTSVSMYFKWTWQELIKSKRASQCSGVVSVSCKLHLAVFSLSNLLYLGVFI